MSSETRSIHWSGCWEVKKGRDICRWFICWNDSSNGKTTGAIGGYSGGGSFQLEKFFLDGDGKAILSFEEDFSLLTPADIESAESCQDYLLDFHQTDPWYDADTLYKKPNKKVGLSRKADLLLGGQKVPEMLMHLFDRVGLTARPE